MRGVAECVNCVLESIVLGTCQMQKFETDEIWEYFLKCISIRIPKFLTVLTASSTILYCRWQFVIHKQTWNYKNNLITTYYWNNNEKNGLRLFGGIYHPTKKILVTQKFRPKFRGEKSPSLKKFPTLGIKIPNPRNKNPQISKNSPSRG